MSHWDGTGWSPLGPLRDAPALHVWDDGTSERLVLGEAGGIEEWDGTQWKSILTDLFLDGTVQALTTFEGDLVAGGEFDVGFYSGVTFAVPRIARWDGSIMTSMGSQLEAPSNWVDTLGEYDEGDGPVLVAGGGFLLAGGRLVRNIASWDGSSWASLRSGTNDAVRTVAAFDDGVPRLYAGGNFQALGTVTAYGIARWNGSNWSALEPQFANPTSYANDMLVHDDGSGPALVVGGSFTNAGGIATADYVAKWDGAAWAPLGAGTSSIVYALETFDDGSGPALYAGGLFAEASGVAVDNIAKWDGATWSALGSGVTGGSPLIVRALAVFDDGSGPALYAGGGFTSAGGVPVDNIAKWDGTGWAPLGSGVDGFVYALAVFDDGSGPALFAGGQFLSAGGVAAKYIAKWDGASWAPVGSGTSSVVNTLLVHDDGTGPTLYVGGYFASAYDSGDSYIARWGMPDRKPPVISHPAQVLVGDRMGSPPGRIVTFVVTATDDQDPAPTVVCSPPSGSFFPPGKTRVICVATDACGRESTSSFNVVVARRVK
jgi:hypothetical protein